MSAQGWAALVLGVAGVVVFGLALVVQLRRLAAGRARPVASAAMTSAQRRRATRQLGQGQRVADEEVAGVRAVAVEAAGQRGLALMLAGTTMVFAAAALYPVFTTVVHVIYAVIAAAQGGAALVLLRASSRGRRFLVAHPDPAGAVVGR